MAETNFANGPGCRLASGAFVFRIGSRQVANRCVTGSEGSLICREPIAQ